MVMTHYMELLSLHQPWNLIIRKLQVEFEQA